MSMTQMKKSHGAEQDLFIGHHIDIGKPDGLGENHAHT
jgi:hypothetical protein